MGHPQARRDLGEMYWKGVGVVADKQAAYMWLLLAASSDVTKSQEELEQLRAEMDRKDVDKATKRAIEWQGTQSPMLLRKPEVEVKAP